MKRITVLIITILLILSISPLTSATEWNVPDDAYAIWYMPNQHLQQPVYEAETWRDWQPIVDAPQSALISTWLNARVITDHCNSKGVDGGRWHMKDIRLGDTAYLITHDGTFKYQCYLTAIVDVGTWGYTINNKILEPASSTDIACRCCVGMDAERNYFAVFRYVKEIK